MFAQEIRGWRGGVFAAKPADGQHCLQRSDPNGEVHQNPCASPLWQCPAAIAAPPPAQPLGMDRVKSSPPLGTPSSPPMQRFTAPQWVRSASVRSRRVSPRESISDWFAVSPPPLPRLRRGTRPRLHPAPAGPPHLPRLPPFFASVPEASNARPARGDPQEIAVSRPHDARGDPVVQALA
jgi:hypothetical protein